MGKPNFHKAMIGYMDIQHKELTVLIEKRYGEKYTTSEISDAIRKNRAGKGAKIREYIFDIFTDYIVGI